MQEANRPPSSHASVPNFKMAQRPLPLRPTRSEATSPEHHASDQRKVNGEDETEEEREEGIYVHMAPARPYAALPKAHDSIITIYEPRLDGDSSPGPQNVEDAKATSHGLLAKLEEEGKELEELLKRGKDFSE